MNKCATERAADWSSRGSIASGVAGNIGGPVTAGLLSGIFGWHSQTLNYCARVHGQSYLRLSYVPSVLVRNISCR